jgi:hypothetical protein
MIESLRMTLFGKLVEHGLPAPSGPNQDSGKDKFHNHRLKFKENTVIEPSSQSAQNQDQTGAQESQPIDRFIFDVFVGALAHSPNHSGNESPKGSVVIFHKPENQNWNETDNENFQQFTRTITLRIDGLVFLSFSEGKNILLQPAN